MRAPPKTEAGCCRTQYLSTLRVTERDRFVFISRRNDGQRARFLLVGATVRVRRCGFRVERGHTYKSFTGTRP